MSKQKNLPNGMSVDSISRAYNRALQRHSPQLIEEIKSFLARDIPEDVKEATVEVFPDEYGDGYASIGLYLAGKTYKNISFAEYANDLPSIDIESYSEEVNIPHLVVDLVKQWFAECWWKACGWDYSLPVELLGHDGFGDGDSIKLTKNC